MKKRYLSILLIAFLFVFNGCATSDTENKSEEESSEHHHSGTTDLPEGLESAPDPKYKEGSQVIIKADHMKGMDGAEATILNSFNTIAYEVTYTPTTGGKKVENHKWVIQDEIKDAGNEMLEKGTEVILEADHMKGMKGAKAVIDSAENTTVYMVDYQPTTGGDMVTNHKWLIEEELYGE